MVVRFFESCLIIFTSAWTWHSLEKYFSHTFLQHNIKKLMFFCHRVTSSGDFILSCLDWTPLASLASTVSSWKPSFWMLSPDSRGRRNQFQNRQKQRRTAPTASWADLIRCGSRARLTTIVGTTETQTATETQRMERRRTRQCPRFPRKQ